jgi:hypothetical protein
MKNLRKLSLAVVLACVYSLSVLAGQTSTPPCAPPDPGQTSTPPCAAAPGDMGTPAATSAYGNIGTPALTNNETSLTEIAADVLQNVLSLF